MSELAKQLAVTLERLLNIQRESRYEGEMNPTYIQSVLQDAEKLIDLSDNLRNNLRIFPTSEKSGLV